MTGTMNCCTGPQVPSLNQTRWQYPASHTHVSPHSTPYSTSRRSQGCRWESGQITRAGFQGSPSPSASPLGSALGGSLNERRQAVTAQASDNGYLMSSSFTHVPSRSGPRSPYGEKEDLDCNPRLDRLRLREQILSNAIVTKNTQEAVVDTNKTNKLAKKTPLDKWSLEYSQQQWTGKSPKEFLADWCDDYLPESPLPEYFNVKLDCGLWKSRVKVVRLGDDDLEATPEVLTDNEEGAENFASVAALYQLYKEQGAYQLLPPLDHIVWLQWKAAEDKAKQRSQRQKYKHGHRLATESLWKMTTGFTKEATFNINKASGDSLQNLASEEEEDSASDGIPKICPQSDSLQGTSVTRDSAGNDDVRVGPG